MKRGREEKSDETSPSPTQLGHGGISTRDINIPIDLTVEILKKLPAKSLVKFQCVSKQWSAIISRSRDFIDSIVTRSLTQPPRHAHLIFEHNSGHPNEWFLVFSSNTCPQDTDKKSLLIPDVMCQYVRGLICCWSNHRREAAIYNLTTRQSFHLPKSIKTSSMGTCFFGYDPLENQYKILFLPLYYLEQGCQVFTLGDPTSKHWRAIEGFRCHFPLVGAICINGVIYYRAKTTECDSTSIYMLMSFDVRSEKFCHLDAPNTLMDHFSFLINYQGKLGFVCCGKSVEIWVREDGDQKTQIWSKIFFYEMEGFEKWRVSGVTRGGEIVFVNTVYFSDDKLCVLYYDPKRNSIRYVDFEGIYSKERRRHNSVLIWTLPDHVENTMRLY
ncbi:unnamed protein product [Arabidopsis halleri]